jgi:nicotinamide-nucleotide amidase
MKEAGRLATAELLAIGTELLVGETRDTNSGDLASELTRLGVEVRRIGLLADRLEDVVEGVRDALGRSDLLVTTGGLGPTPDDLTREAIAQVVGGPLTVDPELEAWLRDRFARRALPFSASNLKQAWRIPRATIIANPNGTAPGWWVDAPGGSVIVALPGPPAEMRPMWRHGILPRLQARGLGVDRASETLRLTGIGESLLVELLGEDRLRGRQPEMATYSRPDAVDLRISATAEGTRSAHDIVAAAVADLEPRLASYLFARGDEGWPEAIGRRLAGRRLALVEAGTAGQLGALLGAAEWLARSESLGPASALADGRALGTMAADAREAVGAEVGLAVSAREQGDDTAVTIAVAVGEHVSEVRRLAFLRGEMGRRRAANVACAELWARLAVDDPPPVAR